MSSTTMTVLGSVAAGLGFVLAAIAGGQMEVQPMVGVALGAGNAMLAFILGATHKGNGK